MVEFATCILFTMRFIARFMMVMSDMLIGAGELWVIQWIVSPSHNIPRFDFYELCLIALSVIVVARVTEIRKAAWRGNWFGDA